MEKVKQILLSSNFIVAVFVLIGLRVTIMGASIGDALAIIGICALQGANKWMETQKDIVKLQSVNADDELRKEITDIKTHMSALLIKNTMRPTQTTPSSQTTDTRKFF